LRQVSYEEIFTTETQSGRAASLEERLFQSFKSFKPFKSFKEEESEAEK